VAIILETTLPHEKLIALASKLTDCHVIAETIEPLDKYDGERRERQAA